ncbi:MAG: hypothetical protein IGS03_14155 [Candidatus Sericytochromatia bacterium]|nr:hypothetical protein [Candidatus Sericytochromatia bacterium]
MPTNKSLHHTLSTIAVAARKLPVQLAMEPVDIPRRFAQAEGQIQGQLVQMHSQRWQNDFVDHLTLALLYNASDELLSVTLSVIPKAQIPLPILGLDYVGFRGILSLVALDLCPVDRDFWHHHAAHHQQALQKSARTHLIQRKIPDFTHGSFSPNAVFAAARSEQFDLAQSLAESLLSTYPQLYREALGEVPTDGTASIQNWKQAMRQNKKEHSALSQIFGEAFTQDYLYNFLFTL